MITTLASPHFGIILFHNVEKNHLGRFALFLCSLHPQRMCLSCWVTVSSLRKFHRYLVYLGTQWDANSGDTGGYTLQYIERYGPPDSHAFIAISIGICL